MAVDTESQEAYLRRALELAEGGRGRVSPNPMVGAVLVRDDAVIGEGFHAELGDLHAERAAIEDCRARGEDPARSTLFVTLEPCAHAGRQPPCTDAILEAGISRVVYASEDPTDKAAGRGPGMLRDSGVEVELATGPEATAARLLNQPFRKRARTGRPLITYKAAMTLDGRLTIPGERWISGDESRRLVHRLRAASDAVAVGMGTVRVDAPRLDARDVPVARQPRRLAFGRGPLPEGSELELRPGPLADELAALASEGVQSLLLEGGPRLASAFVREDLIDKLLVFVAPKLSREGPRLLEESIPLRLTRFEAKPSGDDVFLSAYVHEP